MENLVAVKQCLVLKVATKAVFWRIPGAQDGLDTRQTLGLTRIHGEHAGMRMLTEAQLTVQQAGEVQICGELPTPEHFFEGINARHRRPNDLPHDALSFSQS